MEIEEAISSIRKAAVPVRERIVVTLSSAYGYVLAEDVMAESSVPSFPRSAMDGYAVLAADIAAASGTAPVRLKVIGEILAGDATDPVYAPGTAVRIMTGGRIPEGYDAVVRQEDTDYGEEEVEIRTSLPSGRNCCPVGEEIRAGQKVLSSGERIGRIQAGLLAALGIAEVPVKRKPRIAVISTGSELAEPGTPLKTGQIYNSIRFILDAAIRQAGLEVCFSCTCPDEAEAIRNAIRQAAETADAILTTGGVSVGKKDLLPKVLEDLSAKRLFTRVNIQPGTPTIGSVLDGKVILSLSGNPYAAMANFDLYFWPLIAELTGCGAYLPGEAEAVFADEYEKENRMRRLLRAREEGGFVTLPAKEHMSSVFGNAADCNCYIDLPAGSRISRGDRVKIRRMRQDS